MATFDEQPDADSLAVPHRYVECKTAHLFDGFDFPHCECHRVESDPIHKEPA